MTHTSRPLTIVLGVTGGIAAYKAALVLRLLTEAGHEVRVVPTEDALNMVGAATWEALSHHPIATGIFENTEAVDHVKIAQEADLVLIAPATAHTIAKITAGMADNLLTAVVLATQAPLVIVPAMHTEMWLNAATQANIATLRERGVRVMEPASGRLTGSDTGIGRLPDPEDIVTFALAQTSPGESGDLAGRRFLISAGGTHEALDPVRFLGNRSTGRQGVALAAAAARRGADVTLLAANVAADVTQDLPEGVEVVPVVSARDLHTAVLDRLADVDVLIMAAAVADYRPENQAEHKHKKTGDDGLTLRLVQNPDILKAAVAAKRDGQVIVGFAAETGDESTDALTHGKQKAARKGADLLAINEVGVDRGFGDTPNYVTVVRPDGNVVTEGGGSKADVAGVLLDSIASELS